MPYGSSPSDSNADAVRLLVGDTSTSAPMLADEAYTFFVAETPNIYAAASLAARALAGVASQWTSKSVGDLSLTRSASEYLAMARAFAKQGALKVSPYAGGIDKDDKALRRGDRDKTQPAFRRRMFDSEALDPSGTVTGST